MAGDKDVTVSFASLAIFLDVPCDHWAIAYVSACYDANIVGGFGDGTYQPDWPVTRDQMAVYLARALAGGDDDVPPGPATPSFTDIPSDHWAFKYVEYAVSQNVAQGYPEGDYRADIEVDRAQMAVYIARAMVAPSGEAALADYDPPATPSFEDVAEDFWAYRHVEYCVEQGVVQGYPYPDPDNPAETIYRYQPAWIVTRAQMAAYITRAFNL